MFNLLRDGKVVLENCTDLEATAYIHRTHSYSFSHAVQHEGYSLVEREPKHLCTIDTGDTEPCESCPTQDCELHPSPADESTETATQEAIVHIQRAITLLQHDPDSVFALGMLIPDLFIRATERGETIDPLLGA